jgi:hypothetical protein
MGGLDVIICKELKDLYCRLGGSIWCAETTTGTTSEYHQKRAEKWSAMITELHPLVFAKDFSLKNFRTLLVKYFEEDLLQEIPYIAKEIDTNNYDFAFHKEKWMKTLKTALQKWVNGEYDKN